LGNFPDTFEVFLQRYGQRPASFYLFNLWKGWVLPRKFNKTSKKNKRNFRHGGCNTPEYFAYHYQLKSGCTLSFQEFLKTYGVKPGPSYRFVRGRGWLKKEMKSIWTFLTPDEIFKLLKEIERVCERGAYSYDEAVTVFFTDLNLKGAEKPYGCALRWIRKYLTKTMSMRPKFVPLTALGEAGAEYNQELMEND
jgi:hypothetical protein